MVKKPLPTSEMRDAADDFEAVYESNQPLIYRFMFWRTKDEMLAEDLTSHVFEKAWRTRRNFTGGSAKAWLYKIAHTTLIDYWRKPQEVSDEGAISQAVSEAPELEVALSQRLAVADLQRALTKLPKDMRHVVRLRFIEGRSARETAARLHMSEANVRVIQYRGLKKLRDYLQ